MLKYSEKPLGIVQIWLQSFKLSIDQFFTGYLLLFIPSLFLFLPHLLFSDPSLTEIGKAYPYVNWIFLISESIMIFLWTIVFYQFDLHMKGAQDNFASSLKLAVRKYLPLILMYFLLIVITAFGMIWLILPGIFLLVSLAMSNFFIIFDNEGIIESFSSSFRLMWGNWWRTFAVIIIPLLVINIIVFSVAVVLNLTLVNLHILTNTLQWIIVILQLFITPFIGVYFCSLELLQ